MGFVFNENDTVALGMFVRDSKECMIPLGFMYTHNFLGVSIDTFMCE